MARRNAFEPSPSETVVASGLKITGHLQSSQDIWFDGIIEGNISTEASLTIGPNGRVIGNIESTSIVIAGAVNGNIKARHAVIQSGASLRGDLKVKTLIVAEGAIVNGVLNMPTKNNGQKDAKA